MVVFFGLGKTIASGWTLISVGVSAESNDLFIW